MASTFNKMEPIKIYGTNVGSITNIDCASSTINLSLDVLGNSFINGDLYLGNTSTGTNKLYLNGVDILTSGFTDYSGDITSLNTNVTSLQTSRTTDEATIAANSTNITSLLASRTADEITLAANSTSITSLGLSIATLTTSTATNTTDIATINTNLNLKALDTAVIHNTGNESITGIKTFVSSPIVPSLTAGDNSTKVCNTAYCDAAIASLVGTASASLNTIQELSLSLASDPNFSTTMTNYLALKAPLISPALTGTPSSTTASQGNNSTQIATTAYCDTGLNTKVNASNGDVTGTLTFNTAHQKKLALYNVTANDNQYYGFATTTGALEFRVPDNTKTFNFRYGTSSTTSGIVAKIDPSNGTFDIATGYTIGGASIDNFYANLANSNVFTGTNIFADTIRLTRCCEKIEAVAVTANALSVDFTTNNAIISITAGTANMALTLTSLPTFPTLASYTLSFIINTATNKKYISTININGTAYTMIAAGGLSNISIDASAVYVLQQINIIFISSSTPTKVLTSVTSMY
jgi:hypothetical protein